MPAADSLRDELLAAFAQAGLHYPEASLAEAVADYADLRRLMRVIAAAAADNVASTAGRERTGQPSQ